MCKTSQGYYGENEGEEAIDPEEGVEEQFRETCPDCYSELLDASGGGVKCSNPKCSYWFCF